MQSFVILSNQQQIYKGVPIMSSTQKLGGHNSAGTKLGLDVGGRGGGAVGAQNVESTRK